jgi:hypothetical protein
MSLHSVSASRIWVFRERRLTKDGSGVYRVIELQDGWLGRIIRTQVYFNVLDGAMVTLAMCTFNFAHPGSLLKPVIVDNKDEKRFEA